MSCSWTDPILDWNPLDILPQVGMDHLWWAWRRLASVLEHDHAHLDGQVCPNLGCICANKLCFDWPTIKVLAISVFLCLLRRDRCISPWSLPYGCTLTSRELFSLPALSRLRAGIKPATVASAPQAPHEQRTPVLQRKRSNVSCNGSTTET